jgi:hypothetical protein
MIPQWIKYANNSIVFSVSARDFSPPIASVIPFSIMAGVICGSFGNFIAGLRLLLFALQYRQNLPHIQSGTNHYRQRIENLADLLGLSFVHTLQDVP